MLKDVTSRTIAGVLAAILLAGIWWIYGNLSSILGNIWNWFTHPVPVPVWLLTILAGATLFLVGAVITVWFQENGKNSPSNRFEYSSFNEMEFLSFRWRWDWTSKGFATNMTPYCPCCDRLARYAEGGVFRDNPRVRLFCKNCHHVVQEKSGTFKELVQDIDLEIEHAIRTGRWKQMVKGPEQVASITNSSD